MKERVTYRLHPEADALYARWHNMNNRKYDAAINDHHKGIIAKYQDYCLRFALLLQVCYDGYNRGGVIYSESMEKAIRLTDYFFANMHKALKLLVPETPVDRLQPPFDTFFAQLPASFTIKTAIELGEPLKLKERSVRMFISRHLKSLFAQIERGSYEKIL
jgi:hypothetical protein